MKGSLLVLLLLLLTLFCIGQQPLVMQGHSHNDYKQKRPLFDALDNGFFSVEADIFLRDGDLPVAHSPFEIKKSKTLKTLYLEPLRQIVQKNNGRVYANGPLEFVLMIDMKESGEKIMDTLRKQLEEYKDILTVYQGGVKKPGAVRIVLSGDQNVDLYKNDNPRYVSGDDNLEHINTAIDSSIEPRASANYHDLFSWGGGMQIPPSEAKELIDIIAIAHRYGRKARFYNAPEREDVWKALLDAGEDWVSVDNLPKFRKFYLDYIAVNGE